MQIHSWRAALTTKFSKLEIHRDIQNDNERREFAPVMVISWLVDVNGVGMRIALITYSHKIVSQTMRKMEQYGPAIQHVGNFYSMMKQKGRVNIDKTLFNLLLRTT